MRDLELEFENGIDKIHAEYSSLEEFDFMDAAENASDMVYDEFKRSVDLDTPEKLDRWLEVYSMTCYEIENRK